MRIRKAAGRLVFCAALDAVVFSLRKGRHLDAFYKPVALFFLIPVIPCLLAWIPHLIKEPVRTCHA